MFFCRKLAQKIFPGENMHMEVADRIIRVGVKGKDKIIIAELSEPFQELFVVGIKLW